MGKRDVYPLLGKMPVDVQDVAVDVNLCDARLDVVRFGMPIFEHNVFFARRCRSCSGNFYCSVFGR